jgi:hypothetical protein
MTFTINQTYFILINNNKDFEPFYIFMIRLNMLLFIILIILTLTITLAISSVKSQTELDEQGDLQGVQFLDIERE